MPVTGETASWLTYLYQITAEVQPREDIKVNDRPPKKKVKALRVTELENKLRMTTTHNAELKNDVRGLKHAKDLADANLEKAERDLTDHLNERSDTGHELWLLRQELPADDADADDDNVMDNEVREDGN